MALSDLAVRQAKAQGKAYTLPDQDGLALAVSATGGKAWHFRYYWANKQKRISLGSYPAVTLHEARHRREEARVLIAKGINPQTHRKEQRATALVAGATTFKAVYEMWFKHRALSLKAGRNTSLGLIPRIFKKDILPKLGSRPIHEIKRYELLAMIEKIEQRGALSVAEKVRTWLRQLFRYALAKVPGMEQNPAFDLDVVAVPLPPVNHNPYLRLPDLPPLLQRLRRYRGRLRTQLGIRLLLLTGVRTGELRQATPDQFDLEKGLWIIPPEVVKQLQVSMRKNRQRPQDVPPYIVPLSAQAIEIVRHLLDDLKPLQRYLLRGDKRVASTISENTLNTALKRMGYQNLLTGHGIRSTISTALNEFGYPEKWIDAQLSHVDPNQVRSTYNHAEYVEQRRQMMQDWADRLDLLEQNRVEPASARLVVHLERVSASSLEMPIVMPVSGPGAMPSALTQAWGNAVPRSTSVQRLPAVTPKRLPVELEVDGPQRDRAALFELFDAPHNLPVTEFARLAGKSRRWINYEIQAGNLLALRVGNLAQRVPDWHLDTVKHALIQAVLKLHRDADGWQIYHALTQPCDDLGGNSPIDVVTDGNLDRVIMVTVAGIRTADIRMSKVA